ncbi:MAG: HD-GYP domain-containing protein [Spirochaetaceae bacterium]|nr:HD-GYP domain-containing protein [Spirochaetaceae bacterium]
MNTFNLTEIDDDVLFTKDVVLDNSFLLACVSVPVTAKLKQALMEWEFRQVFSDGDLSQAVADNNAGKQDAGNNTEEVTDEFEENDEQQIQEEAVVVNVMQHAISIVENNDSEKTVSIEDNKLFLVQTVYNEYLKYIEDIYTLFVTHKKLEYERISENIKDLCVFVNDNRRYMLRVLPNTLEETRNYLIDHAMRSTILALAIACQLRMPLPKQTELGVACVLHEIGMLKIPPQIHMSNRKLSAAEMKTIYTHPLFSYNILKEHSFPLSICLGALEHHEKVNGMGYPRRMTGDKISLYAKIIAVACSYEAITAPRSHKTARESFNAMVEILQDNGKYYDPTVIKALLYTISLFPIGAYVFLNNGKIAQVVDVNPANPKLPVVQLFGEKDEKGEAIIIQTGEDVKISRVLTRQEVADVKKSVAK